MYAPEDYQTISPWWPAHGWAMVPEPVLPKSGVVVESAEGEPMAAAFLYMSNSNGVAMMEWAVTNPLNAARESLCALKLLVGAIHKLAVEFDYGVILTSAKQPALVRLYEKCGFKKTDEGMTHLILTTKEAT